MARQWITPREGLTELFPAQLDLPSNPDIQAIVRGFLISLTREYNWEQIPDETITPADAAVLGWQVYESFRRREMKQALITINVSNSSDGGSSVATTWQTRQLNTVEYQTEDFTELTPDLDNYRFGLAPGIYTVQARAACLNVGRTMLRLKLSADGVSTTYVYGDSMFSSQPSGYSVQLWPEISAILDLAGYRWIELQHYTQLALSTYGLGFGLGSNVDHNTFAVVEVHKL